MSMKLTLAKATTVLALMTASGLATNAFAGPTADAPKNTQNQTISASAKLDAVKASFDLLEGDEQRMLEALANPLQFVEMQGSREFTRELIVHANEGKAAPAQSRLSRSMVKSSAFVNEYVVKVPQGVSEGEMAAMLMSTGDYLFVEPNWTLFPLDVPNDSQFGSSWQHTRLQSANAWDLHTGESDIIVAICDSGVDTNHPDLEDAYIPGYNAVNNQAEVNGGQVEDVNGHGTFVSGCAAAQGNNGTGVVGVGWDFSIMPIRVSNNSGGTASGFDILEGARWAVDNGAHVVNASFSGGSSSGNQTAARYIIDRGGLLFWSSGNDNILITYDGPDIVIVGSTTSSDNKSGFSNFGPAVDISAPGSSVRSTRRGGTYGNGSGTSYASPIAAGVGAMIYSVRDDLSGRDVQDILYRSVDDLGAPGRDDSFGRGRVNTFNAIQEAQAYIPRYNLPIDESFDSASWTEIFDSTGTPATVPDAESGSGSVLELNGNDQITSVFLAGRSASTFPGISFSFRTIGVEAGKSLLVEILTAEGSWESVYDYTSTGTDSDGYIDVALQLPTTFLWHGVQLRMSTPGSDINDQWLIDDLFVGVLEAEPIAPLVDSFDSGLISPLKWDDIDGASVEVVGNTYAASMAGEAVLESQDIAMFQFGFVPGYIRFDLWADSNADADDTILVEVRNVIGSWETLDTLDGNELGSSPQAFQYQTPTSAWANDIGRVRFTTAGDDAIYIDNVYYGPDELSDMCSAADFAEPYGQLNFLDVSAFLSAFGSNDLAADLDGSGTFNFLDVSEFLSVFGAGCP
jgi:subtilisin family serine protease